jgi:hypothetical protein
MDEIYKLVIDRIAHKCTKAIIKRLLELGLLAKEHRPELLRRVDAFSTTRHSGLMTGHFNGKYRASHDTTTAY